MSDDRSGLDKALDGASAAFQAFGVAVDVLGPGLPGVTPASFVAPAAEPAGQVEQVETPSWAEASANEAITEAIDDLATMQEAQTSQAVQRADELGEALAEPESAWHSDPPELGDDWSGEAVAGSPDLGESWSDFGDMDAAGDGGPDLGGDGGGGAW